MLGSIRSGLKMKLLIMLTAIFAGDADYCFYILHKGASLEVAIRFKPFDLYNFTWPYSKKNISDFPPCGSHFVLIHFTH